MTKEEVEKLWMDTMRSYPATEENMLRRNWDTVKYR